MNEEKLIKNGSEAKEILIGVITNLESPQPQQWSGTWLEKLKFLAEQIEKDFGADDDCNEAHEMWSNSLLQVSGRIDALIKERNAITNQMEMFIKLQRKHFCPECKSEWRCFDEKCKTNYEMLCPEHDTKEVRERLGGKWAKWVEIKIN